MIPIVLLQPPGACCEFTRSGSVYPPLGLCQLAATVSLDGARVIDADGEGWSDDDTWEQVARLGPSYLGLTATSYTLGLVEAWAARARAAGLRVLVGGPHATLAPHDLLDVCPSVDAVFCGEAEEAFPTIVDHIREGRSLDGVLGVVTRQGTQPRLPVRVSDLGLIPFPRFEGLPLHAYRCPDARRRPLVTFMTARGCPHRCGFCSSPVLLGRKLRGWGVDEVLDELARLVEQLGVREISFVDDVFTIDRSRTLALCRGMAARKLDLTWFCNARADQVTPELARAMAVAGCHQVYVGFESGNQGILDSIHKGATVEELEEGARHLADAGIQRSVGFVLGLPGETDATVRDSIALARRIRPERLQFTRWTPLVGSPLGASLGADKLVGFHSRRDDQVGEWVREAYAACAGEGWGDVSW